MADQRSDLVGRLSYFPGRAPIAVMSIFLVALLGYGLLIWTPPSESRLRNQTGAPLFAVYVNGVYYGDVGIASTTQYLTHKVAYGCLSYRLNVDGQPTEPSMPVLGVKPLGHGHFTCVLFSSPPYESGAHGHMPRRIWMRLERDG